MKYKAIFLDRDGTINEDPKDSGYVTQWDDFRFQPNVIESLKKLSDAGYKLFIISNQGGIARGFMTKGDLDNIHRRMLEKFNKQGVRFEDVLYSTDDPDKPSKTRKPAIGLFQIAAQKLALDKKKSFTIGDTERDLKAGKDFGTKTILVLCGKTNKDDASLFVTQPDRVCQNLAEAVRWILK